MGRGTKSKIEIYFSTKSGADMFYIRVVAANGEIVADGAEGYASKSNAKRAAKKLKGIVASAPIIEESQSDAAP